MILIGGELTVAPSVIVKMVPVIPTLASVLVAGDLPDQNVTFLARGDFTG